MTPGTLSSRATASCRRASSGKATRDCDPLQAGLTDGLCRRRPHAERWPRQRGAPDASGRGEVRRLRLAHVENRRPFPDRVQDRQGKGITFMENNNAWHKRVPTVEEVDAAMRAIG